MSELNAKQKRFVDEYLIDMNATQAAIRAGYSEKNAASIAVQLLNKTHVAEAVNRAISEREERTKITKDLVVQNLWEAYKVCSTLVAKLNFEGKQDVDKDGKPAWRMVDASNAMSALDKLMKHVGGYEADNKRDVGGEIIFGWRKPE